MSVFSRISSLGWLIVLAGACGFLAWGNHVRRQRVEYVSGLAGQAERAAAAAGPNGSASGRRYLIVPERNEASYGWLAQTQQMMERGECRVRHVDSDNAPFGRDVNAASPYRWWLGGVAWVEQAVFGWPIDRAVERAALVAEPLLHALLLVGTTVFVAWRFGGWAAGLTALGVVTLFPFAAGFLPGVPDHHGLARACALGSILVLLGGLRSRRHAARWFALAGVAGGIGLWVDVPTLVPVLGGVLLGGLLAAGIRRCFAVGAGTGDEPVLPWWSWAIGGAMTVLAAYLIEFFPAHLGMWRLETVHPLYGLAWLGAGGLLAWISSGIRPKGGAGRLRRWSALLLVLAALAAVPAAMHWFGNEGFLARDPLSFHLTNQPDGVAALSFWGWLVRAGANATLGTMLVPLIVIVPAIGQLLRRSTDPETRIAMAVAMGPVLVSLGFACGQLGWWHQLDGALLGLIVAVFAQRAAGGSRFTRWLGAGTAVLLVVPGLIQLWPAKPADAGTALTAAETQELIERHLAHWLAKRTEEPGAVVYAPPSATTTLCYYGGFRGIGTFVPENRSGFGAALKIAAANTIEDAQALLQEREVRYVVVPSWDPFFDEFAQRYLDPRFSKVKSVLVDSLRRWSLPLWLRPLPYQMPAIRGFEGQSVLVFEVVDPPSPAVAASRTAEYFVETGKLQEAAASGEYLRRFPGDVGALAARAQVQSARGDAAGAAQTLDALLPRLASGGDRYLPWDRRVSLAMVLAQGDRIDLAREQVRRCVAELNAKRLRSLNPGLLFNFQVLSRAFDLPIADPELRALALELLPGELRSRL